MLLVIYSMFSWAFDWQQLYFQVSEQKVNYFDNVAFQVMIDFQAAERKRLEEPASEIGLESLCAMVCKIWKSELFIVK